MPSEQCASLAKQIRTLECEILHGEFKGAAGIAAMNRLNALIHEYESLGCGKIVLETCPQ
jgi:hypothetical protein